MMHATYLNSNEAQKSVDSVLVSRITSLTFCLHFTHHFAIVVVETCILNILRSARAALLNFSYRLYSCEKVHTCRMITNKIRKIYKICLYIELICHKRKM